jgi:hypothetical protein
MSAFVPTPDSAGGADISKFAFCTASPTTIHGASDDRPSKGATVGAPTG